MDPTKLSKNKMLLTGIGEAQVTTIGSFEHEFKIDDENYSLTWHVVPTDKLKFEAVIGSDLLEQASISFTKEGVKFNKYENHAQLMQISAETLQEELDLRHVENRQIKKELEKLIQDYKPEKTASTDVTMRIILKDEEPVCQHPRRLAFTERQEVNKQIEEMAKELLEQREFLRNDAKKNIENLQTENRKTYNRRRKKASLYKEGDLVAIQRTQFGAGLKLRPKFLGPYKK
ncbi:RVP domain-containing protein [Trichonephila clavipes]|nr:RVP domain-containing protein [Trichonephila clavipes]